MTDVTLPSGIAKDELDAERAPAGRPVPPRQRQVDRAHRDPGRQGPLRLVLRAARGGREGRARHHRRGAAGRAGHRGAQGRRPLRELPGRGSASSCSAPRPSPASSSTCRCISSVDAVPRRPSAGSSARASPASCSSSSTTTRATPSATSSSSSRAASACPTRATTARRSSPTCATPTRAPRAHVRASPARRRGRARGARLRRSRPTIAAAHWDNVRTRDSEKTYNLIQLGGCRGRGTVDLQRVARRHGRARAARSTSSWCASRASSRASARCSPRSASRRGGTGSRWQVIRSSAAYLSNDFVEANFDFYGRTLTGTPQMRDRWKRGVSLVEGAMGEAVGRIYVERHFPPAREGGDGRARRQPRRGLPPVASPTLDWMSDETRERALDKLEQVHAEDRLPGEVARLLEPRDRPPTTWSATCARPPSSSSTASSARSASRSTATSGS